LSEVILTLKKKKIGNTAAEIQHGKIKLTPHDPQFSRTAPKRQKIFSKTENVIQQKRYTEKLTKKVGGQKLIEEKN
jgi:hypothetical protein